MAGGNGQNELDVFSMANMPIGSPRLWVHWVCVWVFSVVTYYYLYHLYDEYRTLRHKHLIPPVPSNFSVLVHEVRALFSLVM